MAVPVDEAPATLMQATGFGYFPIALFARFPMAMVVVGALTLVVSARDDIALAGFTAAVTGIGTAIFGPLIGAAADRFGQRPVMLISGGINSLALLALAWVSFSPLDDRMLLPVAFVMGATAPQVSSMSRSRLVLIIQRRLPRERKGAVRNSTMAYESAADEIVFVFGPLLVGILATTLNPAAPIIGAAVLTLVFVTAFALHRTGDVQLARTGAGEVRQAPASELFRPAIVTVAVGTFGMGLFFGATLTALTAFMGDVGTAEQAGLVYGVMGTGSAVLALAVAWFSPRFQLRARWLSFAALIVAGTAILPFAEDLSWILLALLVMGFGVGPTLVTQFSLTADRSPEGRSATAMTVVGSGLVLGQSAASAVVGLIAESAGTTAALWAPLGASMVVLLSGMVNWFMAGSEPTRPSGAAAAARPDGDLIPRRRE